MLLRSIFIRLCLFMIVMASKAFSDDPYGYTGTTQTIFSHITKKPLVGVSVKHNFHRKYTIYYTYLNPAYGIQTLRTESGEEDFILNAVTNENGAATVNYSYLYRTPMYCNETYNGYPVEKTKYIMQCYPLLTFSIPGFVEPYIQNGIVYTHLDATIEVNDNKITVEVIRSGLNKILSDQFYSQKLNFHKDIIKSGPYSTGFELGAPILDPFQSNAIQVRIPLYLFSSNVLYSGAIKFTGFPTIVWNSLDGSKMYGMQMTAISTQNIEGLSNSAHINSIIVAVNGLIASNQYSFFIPVTTPELFSSSYDANLNYFTYAETSFQMVPTYQSSEKIKLTFQSKYVIIKN